MNNNYSTLSIVFGIIGFALVISRQVTPALVFIITALTFGILSKRK